MHKCIYFHFILAFKYALLHNHYINKDKQADDDASDYIKTWLKANKLQSIQVVGCCVLTIKEKIYE